MDQNRKASAGQLKIRRLGLADLKFAQTVRELAGWNQTDADWRRFLGHEPDGCFLAEWDGVPAGTVTTTAYGGDLAWIGMMLVHPDCRRRGISTALMRQSIAYLQGRGVRCIKLDATPAGEPVYQRLGFRAEWKLRRWEAVLPEPVDQLGGSNDFIADLGLDREIFGADRAAWLQRLAADSRVVSLGRAGYGMTRQGMRANYVGPIVAADPETGGRLAHTLVGALGGRTFWDVPDGNEAAVAVAQELGFKPVRDLLRMWLGEQNVAGDPRRQFAIGDPATG